MSEDKKFNAAEIVIGVLFFLIIDGVSALLDVFVPVIGWFGATVLQAIASFGTTLWVMSKGSKRATRVERQLIKQVSNFLPIIPTVTTAFVIEVVLHNNEKIGKIISKGK